MSEVRDQRAEWTRLMDLVRAHGAELRALPHVVSVNVFAQGRSRRTYSKLGISIVMYDSSEAVKRQTLEKAREIFRDATFLEIRCVEDRQIA